MRGALLSVAVDPPLLHPLVSSPHAAVATRCPWTSSSRREPTIARDELVAFEHVLSVLPPACGSCTPPFKNLKFKLNKIDTLYIYSIYSCMHMVGVLLPVLRSSCNLLYSLSKAGSALLQESSEYLDVLCLGSLVA